MQIMYVLHYESCILAHRTIDVKWYHLFLVRSASKLTKEERERLKREEAERKAREEGDQLI